jgi:hypothetical protein
MTLRTRKNASEDVLAPSALAIMTEITALSATPRARAADNDKNPLALPLRGMFVPVSDDHQSSGLHENLPQSPNAA